MNDPFEKKVRAGAVAAWWVVLAVAVVNGLTTSADERAKRPAIKKLGTLDLLMVETTPVVFKDRLYRFEYLRDNYPANKTGAS